MPHALQLGDIVLVFTNGKLRKAVFAMRNKFFVAIVLVMSISIVACGTIATPVPNLETLEAQNQYSEVVEEPTGVVEVAQNVATATPTIAPSATPTPTEEATPEPTEDPTEAPTEVVVAVPAMELSVEEEQHIIFIQEFGSIPRGQEIFNTTYEVNTMSGLAEWKCATCHAVDSDVAGVGPGLYSLSDRAGGRIAGMPAELYVYYSITIPAQHIVSGYPENLMPIGYGEIFTPQDIYDVATYVLSLNQ